MAEDVAAVGTAPVLVGIEVCVGNICAGPTPGGGGATPRVEIGAARALNLSVTCDVLGPTLGPGTRLPKLRD